MLCWGAWLQHQPVRQNIFKEPSFVICCQFLPVMI